MTKSNLPKYFWEKGGYCMGKCDLCGIELTGIKSRRKFESFVGFGRGEDETIVSFCEECFLKTR